MQGPTGHRGDPRTIDRRHGGAVAFRYGDVGHLGCLLGEAGQDDAACGTLRSACRRRVPR